MISPELLAVLITIATAIAGAFGLYFNGKAKGKAEAQKQADAEKLEQISKENARLTQESQRRIDKLKAIQNAHDEAYGLPTGAASERLHDEFSRDS